MRYEPSQRLLRLALLLAYLFPQLKFQDDEARVRRWRLRRAGGHGRVGSRHKGRNPRVRRPQRGGPCRIAARPDAVPSRTLCGGDGRVWLVGHVEGLPD